MQTATDLGSKFKEADITVEHYGSFDVDSDPKQQLEILRVR